MKTKVFFVTLFYLCILNANAENNVIDNPELLYQPRNEDTLLNNHVTVKRILHNINELSDILDGINGISTQVLGKSGQRAIPVNVYLNNATLTELLNVSANKLGYTWSLKGNKVIFRPVLPILSREKLASNSLVIEIAQSWSLNQQDKTLRNALGKWCAKSGWHLVWNVGADYPIVVPWVIKASFESAINQVLRSTQLTGMPLEATMHDNNKVLEIYSLNLHH